MFEFNSATIWTGFAVIVAFLYYYYGRVFNVFKRQGIKGPTPLPIVGNMLSILRKPPFFLDREWGKKYGKIYSSFDGHKPVLNVTDLDMLKAIFIKDFNYFMDRRTIDFSKIEPAFNTVLTSLDGEKWRTTRNIVSPVFTSGKLKAMLPLMKEVAQELSSVLCELAEKDEEVEAKKYFSGYTMDSIASCGFGIEIKSIRNPENPFVVSATKVFKGANSLWFFVIILFPSILKYIALPIFDAEGIRFFKESITEIIKERKETKRHRSDFLQLMIEAEESEEVADEKSEAEEGPKNSSGAKLKKRQNTLSADFVIGQAMQFFLAGFESVATTITYAAYCLATNPEAQEKLIREIDKIVEEHGDVTYEYLMTMPYLDMVLNETLRLYPIAFRLERKCVQDYLYNSIEIPKGTIIQIPAYAIHRMEEYYPDPDEFIPERFSPENKSSINPISFLPFGSGPRNCIGMRLAIMECKTAIVEMLRKVTIHKCSKTQVPLTFTKATRALIPDGGIWLKFQKREE